MQNLIRTAPVCHHGNPWIQEFESQWCTTNILLASREGNVPRLRGDIENAGNCDYLTITYISLLITLFYYTCTTYQAVCMYTYAVHCLFEKIILTKRQKS